MKKLMIAAAIVCAAAFAQAATVNWQTGTLKAAKSKTGGKGSDAVSTRFATGTDLAVMVFTIDKDAYDKYAALDQKAIYDNYSSKEPTVSKDANANSISDAGTSAAVGVTQYAAVIVTYTDKDWGDFYIAQVATIDGTKITSDGGTYSVTSIASGASAGASNWQAVPEPTSAMLMLLGFAGLALRRRRA